jgi:LmbE family N-acetylglucosaminyl deacetylase
VHWIYLSPHFDDVALSCGGLLWAQVQAGDSASIWTVCAGSAPVSELSPFAQELHTRWQVGQNAIAQRRIEDLNSCQRLGAAYRYFSIPDCIYRRNPLTGEFIYASETSLNGPLQPGDTLTITALREELNHLITTDMVVVSPLALGSHVDHQLTRLAAEGLDHSILFYADYPYVLRCKEQVENMEWEGWVSQVFPLSQEALTAWQDSITAHSSQISTFWSNEIEMRRAIVEYFRWKQGIQLWRKPGS